MQTLSDFTICIPDPQGGDSTPSYPRMCGPKLEGNGSFLSLEGGKRCPPIWV